MNSKERFQNPPVESRPLYLWTPDWRGGAKWIFQRLDELRGQGWGGVVLRGAVELACVRAERHEEGFETGEIDRNTALAALAVETARKKGLEVWLDALGAHQWGELGPWRRGANAVACRRSLRFVAEREVLSAETVRWKLPHQPVHPLILGVTEGGHVMDVTRLYHEGVVEGMVPLAVARFVALEELRDPRAPDPYDADACRTMISWAFTAVADALGHASESINGLYLDALTVPPCESGAAPWSDAFRDHFTLKYKAEVLEVVPWLFLPGEGKPAMHRTRFWSATRDCEAEGFPRVLREEAQARGWSISRAARVSSPMASMADLAALADKALMRGATRIAYHPDLNELAPRVEVNGAASFSVQEPYEPWLDCFTHYCARLSVFAQASEETVSALTLTPQTACTLFSLDPRDQGRMRDCLAAARLVSETLQHNQYNHEEIDESRLDELELDEEMLLTRQAGAQLRRYAVLVIPPMPVIGKRAASALVRLADEGALMLFAGGVPDIMCDNGERESLREQLDDAIEELGSVKIAGDDWLRILYEWVPPSMRIPRRADLLRYRRFTLPDGEAALLANCSDGEAFQGALESLIPGANALQLDAVTGKATALKSEDGRTIELNIPPGCSNLVWFRRAPSSEVEAVESRITDHVTFTGPFVFFAGRDNAYPLGRWEIEDGAAQHDDEDGAAMRRRMTTRFWVSGAQRRLRLAGWGHFSDTMSISLNGEPLTPSVNGDSLACDLTPFLLEGENRLEIIVLSLNEVPSHRPPACGHCPPTVTLLGDFAVIEQGRHDILAPPAPRIGAGSWTLQGYPFFSGVGVYRLRVPLSEGYENRRLFLRLEDTRHAAEVCINEETAGVIWRAPRRLEITGRMKVGDNLLELRVANTLQNLLGRRRVPSGLLGAVHLEVGERVF